MGAVNCVVVRARRLIGDLDEGFVAGVRRLVDPAGQSMVLLGAGVPRARSPSRWRWSASCWITVVSPQCGPGSGSGGLLNGEVRAAADELTATHAAWAGDYLVPGDTGIVVNATDVGLTPTWMPAWRWTSPACGPA